MTPIKMVDLDRQYQKIKPEITASFQDILENTAFINGPQVQEFCGKLGDYLGVKWVIPCANGTDALQIALMALDLEPGDEVITPSFTFIATAEVVALLRLKPVFVDVDPVTFCMDPQAVRQAVTPKTKVIIPVHLFGQSADIASIMQLAEENNLTVIEDNAQAIGSDYTFTGGTKLKTGAIGTIGCTSFFPSKTLGCYGDGGAIMTDDEKLAKKLSMIANHGQSRRYYHDVVGCNSRLDSLQAAVLSVKIDHLDEYIAARRKAADYYDAGLNDIAGIEIPKRTSYSKHTFHQYTVKVKDGQRDALHQHLVERNVPTMIYYPVPAHAQQMFAELKGIPEYLPVTDQLKEEVLSLPMHTELDEEQLAYIVSGIQEFFNK